MEFDPVFKEFKRMRLDDNSYDQIYRMMIAEINLFYKPGDIMSYNASKIKTVKQRSPFDMDDYILTFTQSLTRFVTNGSLHGGKLCQNGLGEIETSEIFKNFTRAKFGLYQIVISDIWALDSLWSRS